MRLALIFNLLAPAMVMLAVLQAAPVPAMAAALTVEDCSQLEKEKQALIVLGVEKQMAQGAEWAKANLKPAELDLIKRYFTVDETIKFRCGEVRAQLARKQAEELKQAEQEAGRPLPPLPTKRPVAALKASIAQ